MPRFWSLEEKSILPFRHMLSASLIESVQYAIMNAHFANHHVSHVSRNMLISVWHANDDKMNFTHFVSYNMILAKIDFFSYKKEPGNKANRVSGTDLESPSSGPS